MSLLALLLTSQEATLRGTVEVGHRVAPPRMLRLDSDPKVASMRPNGYPDESLAVDPGNRLKWAFVYVKRGLEGRTFPIPKSPVVLEYNRGILTPRVFGLRAGQELLIRNRDSLLHNCHSFPNVEGNREFNFGLPQADLEERKHFDAPEVPIRLRCEIHEYDTAWAGVLPHPFFAITDEHGRYEIRGLPPGRYTIEAHHEKCVPVEREIEVTAGEVRTMDFVVATKDGPPPRHWKPYLIAGGAMCAAMLFLGFLLFRRPRSSPRAPAP